VKWFAKEILTWDESPTDGRRVSSGYTKPNQLYTSYADEAASEERASRTFFTRTIKKEFHNRVQWTSMTNLGKCDRCVCFKQYEYSGSFGV